MYRPLLCILLLISLLYTGCMTSGSPARDKGEPLFLITEHDRVGYINSGGEKIIAPRFLNGNDYSEGLAAVRKKGSYGYIDRTGRFVIAPAFDFACSFKNGLAVVRKGNDSWYINTTGKKAFPAPYKHLGSFFNGRAAVISYGGLMGFINLHGDLVIDTLYQRMNDFCNGRAVVTKALPKEREQPGVIDTGGRIIVPFGVYTEINDFNNGYAVVKSHNNKNGTDDKDGVIDTNGKLLFERPYENSCSIYGNCFTNGLASMTLYKYWIPEAPGVLFTSEKGYQGYINLRNEIVLNDTTVEYAEAFSDGRAFIMKKDSEYFMVDTAMHRVGTAYYRRILGDKFRDGYAIVSTDSGWGIIDTGAHWAVRPSFDDIDETGIRDGYFFYGKDTAGDKKLYGIAGIGGEIVLGPVLSDFDRSGFVNGLLKAAINDRLCYINKQGKIVWQNQDTTIVALHKLNVDCMLREGYLAYSTPEKTGEESRGGGWYISDNTPRATTTTSFKAPALSLTIDVQKVDTFAGRFTGHPLYLANTTADTILFNAQDSRLYMKLQARDAGGEWKDIEYIPSSWCGNSYHRIALEPAHYWSFVIPEMEGEIPVRLRVELKYVDKDNPKKDKLLYSNEIAGHINPGQYWRKQAYSRIGIMDPYNE